MFLQSCTNTIKTLNETTKKLSEVFKVLGDQLAILRLQWLPIEGGNWPDRFVLLNRYVRTDEEPEYFSDSRVVLA